MAKKKKFQLPEISISIVSHLHSKMIFELLLDIEKYCKRSLEVILTINQEENLPFLKNDFSFSMKIIKNPTPQGFARNHNQAFKHAKAKYFCILNPDIRLKSDPFEPLLKCLQQNTSIGIAAPKVINSFNQIEDSARVFPTPLKILYRLFTKTRKNDYIIDQNTIYPEWVAGMFLLIPSKTFQIVGLFDERFFLYYEDVDLCARLRLLNYEIALCPNSCVIHNARRASHQNIQFFYLHLKSMMKFFLSKIFIKIMLKRKTFKQGFTLHSLFY